MSSRASRFTALLSTACLWVSSAAYALNSTWVGGATGSWSDAGNWSAGVPQAAGDTATINTPAAIAVPASITLKTLFVTAPATVTVASGATLAFSNGGGDVLTASAALTIDGDGELTFSRNGTSTTDFANIKPASGVTVTLAARITGVAGAGIELNAAGTLLLTNPGNSFTGRTRISTANGTLAFSDPAALGTTAIRFDGSPSRFAYTGSGSATLTLPVELTAGSATLENAGTGALTLNGLVAPVSAGNKTLTFAGAARTNIVSGTIANGAGNLTVVAGSGTLLLDGAVTNSALTANGGSTLAIGAGADIQSRTLTCNAGATVAFNPAAAASFTALLPATNALAGAGVRFVLPAAATASTATLPALTRASAAGSLDVAGDALGTAANTLVIQNAAPGPLPAWFTVNGQPAAYDAVLGVIPAAASATNSLTALGPSVITDDPAAAAVIDSAGTSGGITLAADPTTVFALIQDHAADPAAVDLGGQTLAAPLVAVAAAGNSLTLANGTLAAPTAQTPPAGAATFPTLATPPIAWFDLADDATVTTNAGGRITLLANKGSLGSALDAVAPADRIGPRYVPAAVNGLGVARSDGIAPPQGLATLGNAGITGNAPRTAFLVARRSPVTANSFYALFMGANATANQTFAIVERTSGTSFVTQGNDLEGTPQSPPGHNVLTFITGLDSVPNAGAGFRNGTQVGAKTFALATADSPILLLHRVTPASAFSGPGEVAEAIVFDYTLSETDRAAVESYLMHKWGIAAQRDDALLALRNENPAADLDVSAAVTEAYGTTLALAKSGPGDVTLGGPVNFSGALLLGDGTLTFDTPAGRATELAAAVSGPGALLKDGPGDLALSLASTFAGGTTVQGGTLYPGANGSLGTGPVTVESGGALDLANGSATANPVNGTAAFANPVSVAGAGPDGLGALRHSDGVNQLNALKTVTLTDDAAVYSASRVDVRAGAFDFGGHSLTVNGGGEFSIAQSAIANVTPDTDVHVADGMMRFEQSDFLGSAANLASAASGSGVSLHQMTVPMAWALQLADNAYLRVINGGTDTNLNRWAGPVTLSAGTARLNALAGGTAAITGAIGGDGGLLKEGDGWAWLFNPANTYAGDTAVTQGTLYAVSPGALGTPGAAGLTVSGTGTFVARAAATASPDGWSDAEIASIADGAVFVTPGATALGFDTVYDGLTFSANLPYIGLKKFGPHTLTLSGSAPDLGAVEVHDGELDLSGSGAHNLHTYSLAVGASSAATTAAVLRLAGATLSTDDPGYNRAGPVLAVGSAADSRGVAHLGDDAVANGRLIVGDAAGSAGAVYQTGGSVTNTGGIANDAALGVSGYGYYRLDGGTLAHKGSTQFGRLSGSTGLFEQRGGNLLINPGAAPADGVVGDYYNGTFTTRKGVGVFLLSGGTFNLNAHSLQLGEWANAGDYNDGTGILTIENDAQAETAQIVLANRNGAPQAFVNLNGGTLTTPYFQKGGNNTAGNSAVAAVHFDGGVLRVPSAGNGVSSLVRTGANNSPALLNVYDGGAVIETLDAGNIALDLPLLAPAGFGVTAVTLTAPGAGYLAPPAVLLTGGSGTGATAVAEIDLGTGALTAVRVTSPGVGYTSAPAVTLRGGGYTAAAAATASLGVSASGGLTKLGTGTLSLNTVNSYTGPTVVSNGTLRLGAGAQTLTTATPITVAGGTLDLAGNTLTNNNPVVIDSGRLVNGTVSALAFTKSGSGEATLAAAPVVASAEALYLNYVRTLAPVAWYDPSDANTVTLNGSGRVIALANKGSRGSALNAAPTATPNLSNPPLLATGAVSYAASGLPMLKIDANNTGLATDGTLGITGAVPRTVVAVLTRESDTTAAYTCFGATSAGQLWEVGDRADGSSVVIGGFSGYDLSMTPRPTAKIAHVLCTQLTASNTSEAWRTGDGQNYKSFTAGGNFNTGDSRFFIGNRVDASKTTARGEIGEILIFDRLLSSDEREQLMTMLQQKWTTVDGLAEPEGESVAITVAEGTLRLAPGADAIAALSPAVWYDPSDAATVTTNTAGRVTALVNKGARGSAMDADLQSGFQGPLLVQQADSYSAAGRPMLKIDANATGLRSASNTGINGTAPRTLIAVLSRDTTSPDPAASHAVIGFGRGALRQLVELGDRSDGVCFGLFGDDLTISPVLAPARANIYMMASTAANEVTGWRSGGAPNRVSKTLGGNWATAGDTPLHLGYRFGTTARANFRGQIGEVLLFDRLLSAQERADVEDYLVNKWTRADGADQLFSGTTFDVAAGATLDLGGAREGVTVTGAGTVTNGTLGAGFVISPAGDEAVGELTLAGVAFGSGAEYRLTILGEACDRLLVSGDLSGLTVVPATGAAIVGGTYVIATGAVTEKPALSGFPEKFKLIQRGSDLLLTSTGGTLLMLH